MSFHDKWLRYRNYVYTACLVLGIGLMLWARGLVHRVRIVPPHESYGELFYQAMNTPELFGEDALFVDEKDFLDAFPRVNNEKVREAFLREVRPNNSQALRSFMMDYFVPPVQTPMAVAKPDSLPIGPHIQRLWKHLRRYPLHSQRQGTHLPLTKPYIVPGGRFRELYYWDSYFTMLGLLVDGREEDARDMLDNFSALITAYGFVPNGTRTYYGTRSQPPFFSHMVEALLVATHDSTLITNHLSSLRAEYDFWMRGHTMLTRYSPAVLRTVRMPGGEVLNRYYDNAATPREENYRADCAAGQRWCEVHGGRNASTFYRHLRASSESGWDNSSRWLTNPHDPLSINTTNIVPVDLNSLLYHTEQFLAMAYRYRGDGVEADRFAELAEARKRALLKYFWQSDLGYFTDINLHTQQRTPVYTTAGLMPLFVGIASAEQGERVSSFVRGRLLKMGGVSSSTIHSGLKWDTPNGWAPAQWIAYVGLRRVGQLRLAKDISKRWRHLVATHYTQTHKLCDRYNVVDASAVMGEYPTQDGFGWTNAVYQLFDHYAITMEACPVEAPQYLKKNL